MSEWYYTKMGLQQGPVPLKELQEMVRKGMLSESCQVWHDGMPDWLPITAVPELYGKQAEKLGAQAGERKMEPVVEEAVLPPPLPSKREFPQPQASEPQLLPQNMGVPEAAEPGELLPQPPPHQGEYEGPDIPTYMTPSIVVTVISGVLTLMVCFSPGLITGIVAIVYANKVDKLKVQRRLVEAGSASKTAKTWMIVSYVLMGLTLLLAMLALIGFLIGLSELDVNI